jgi:threonine dehydrogenase-like Zn-dependent dehydrogenase
MRTLELVDRPRPALSAADSVLVRIAQTGLCGTDRSVLVGKFDARPGVIMGHEAVGTVAEKGEGARSFAEGDRVVVNPTLYCGTCEQCRRGRLNFCMNKAGAEVGIDRDGAFADYIELPGHFCHHIPADMAFDRAVVIEPLACALNNLEAGGLRAGETAVIVGGGPMGAVCAMAAELYGARVLLVEADTFRQEACRTLLESEGGRVSVHAPGDAALAHAGDVVFETVGNLLEQSLAYAADSGRVVVIGYNTNAVAAIRPLQLLQRGLRVIGAGDYNSHDFPRAVAMARHLPLERLVTHHFGIEDFDDALKTLAPGPGGAYAALKAVITLDAREEL